MGVRHVDGVDDVFAVGRDLAHEAEALLRVLFREGTPAKQVVVGDGADFLEGNERVKSLVVGGAVDVDAHGLAVAREGVAVAAGGQVGHHDLALGPVDVAELPLDFGQHGVGKRLDDAALLGVGIGRNERDVAIEDGCADRIFGGRDGGFSARERLAGLPARVAADDDPGRLARRSAS